MYGLVKTELEWENKVFKREVEGYYGKDLELHSFLYYDTFNRYFDPNLRDINSCYRRIFEHFMKE